MFRPGRELFDRSSVTTGGETGAGQKTQLIPIHRRGGVVAAVRIACSASRCRCRVIAVPGATVSKPWKAPGMTVNWLSTPAPVRARW
ncbi:Uncharacterised protein [Nocardia africana]|uniref:Uncharacterized protein n=1 Tax=Nocardia africana TaxID=134964 RepID=A0A378WYG8_9NOCA|nr:Uncharacterised protein [Nocardia africana]